VSVELARVFQLMAHLCREEHALVGVPDQDPMQLSLLVVESSKAIVVPFERRPLPWNAVPGATQNAPSPSGFAVPSKTWTQACAGVNPASSSAACHSASIAATFTSSLWRSWDGSLRRRPACDSLATVDTGAVPSGSRAV